MPQHGDSYITFINAQGTAVCVVVAWVGSIVGPLLIAGGIGNYGEWPVYFGVAFTIAAVISIWHGFKALGREIYTDFVIYAVVPLLLPASSIVLLVVTFDA